MSGVSIELADDRDTYRPRETIRGCMRWDLSGQRADTLRLELLWHTEGKGTRDADVVDTLTLEQPPARGERAFAFTLPAGPYSFSGKLLSVLWMLQVIVEPGDEVTQRTLVISPVDREIDLAAEDDDDARARDASEASERLR